MNVELTYEELAYIKIALSQWHATITLEAIKGDDDNLHNAAHDIFTLLNKIGAVI